MAVSVGTTTSLLQCPSVPFLHPRLLFLCACSLQQQQQQGLILFGLKAKQSSLPGVWAEPCSSSSSSQHL